MLNFLELVPRNLEELEIEAKALLNEVPRLAGINIPDVLRLHTRSHDAAALLLKAGITAIPHMRSMDRSVAQTLEIVSSLIDLGLNAVLIVSGDKPTSPDVFTYEVTPIKVIEALKQKFPALNVYGALDPYRSSLKHELAYCEAKREAGADGFFTQPFFDPAFARLFLEQLEGTEVFVGMSPVLSEKSLNYWKTKNMAVFPKQFQLNLDWNCALGKSIVEVAQSLGHHTYMMPITVSAEAYVKGVLG